MNKLLVLFFMLGFISCSKTKLKDVKPQLEITVVDDGEVIMSGVDVSIYETKSDWENKTNHVDKGTTDSQGVVLFRGLKEQVYYFFAEKGALSNDETTVKVSKELKNNIKAKIQITIK